MIGDIINLLIIGLIIYALYSAYNFFFNYGWMNLIPGYSYGNTFYHYLVGDNRITSEKDNN
jgi:hypothetical protein